MDRPPPIVLLLFLLKRAIGLCLKELYKQKIASTNTSFRCDWIGLRLSSRCTCTRPTGLSYMRYYATWTVGTSVGYSPRPPTDEWSRHPPYRSNTAACCLAALSLGWKTSHYLTHKIYKITTPASFPSLKFKLQRTPSCTDLDNWSIANIPKRNQNPSLDKE